MSIDQELSSQTENSSRSSESARLDEPPVDDGVCSMPCDDSARDASTSTTPSPVSLLSKSDEQSSSIDCLINNGQNSCNLQYRQRLKLLNNVSVANTSSGVDFTIKQKVAAVLRALNSDPVDIISLRRCAISKSGLVNDALRRKVWPKLLNVNVFSIRLKPTQKVLKSHRDYNQVVMDVNRSLKRFPPGMKDDQRLVLQDQLVNVIMRILVKHKDLHYYQGYHDICVTFLLIVGEEITFSLIDKLSTNHLRDFMDKTMDRTSHMLNYLYPIIGRASPALRRHMEDAELGTIFCLPWLITWYGHVMGDFRHVVRLYDFFLACHPLMPIYLAAAMVLYREQEVLDTDCDMAMIHCLLSRIPADLPWERLISNAGDLYVQYPPSQLAFEAQQHFTESSSITNYNQFIKTMPAQRPDSILKQSAMLDSLAADKYSTDLRTRLARYSAWALSAGLAAAAIAAVNTALELGWF